MSSFQKELNAKFEGRLSVGGTCAIMAGQVMETEGGQPRRVLKKRFEEDLDRLSSSIKSRELELRNLQQQSGDQADQAGSRSSNTVWLQRDETIAQRRAIDERLQAANREITVKRDALARIHSTLNYKSEDRINEAIKRLEYQLSVNNFKVNEEKRIVKEIDTLNRSRRNLKEYLLKKSELDRMAKEQQATRSDRDALFRAEIELKQKGDCLRKEVRERKARIETLKKELDDLYAERRQLTSSFRLNFSKFKQHRPDNKRQPQKKEPDEDQREEHELCHEAFSEERNLCITLLNYLQRFECGQVMSALTPTAAIHDHLISQQHPNSEGHTPVTPSDECTILRRKEECGEEDWCSWGSGRGVRAKRNHTKKLRQQQKKKVITHTQLVFEQFSQLQLDPPSLLAEVPVAIEQLKAKKKFFDHLSEAGKTEDVPVLPLYSLSGDKKSNSVNDLSDLPKADAEVRHKMTSTSDELLKQRPEVQTPSESDESPVVTIKCATSMPKALVLKLNSQSLHVNGYENGLDEVDMGYASGNGCSRFEGKKSKKIVKNVQAVQTV